MSNHKKNKTKTTRPYFLLLAFGLLYLFLFFCLGQFRTNIIKAFVDKSSAAVFFHSLSDDFEPEQESGASNDDFPIDGKESKDFIYYCTISGNLLLPLSIEKNYSLLKGRPLSFVFFEKNVPPPEHTTTSWV
jgi:hypothetical protein